MEIERGDLNDPTTCDRASRDVSLVFHCAAKVGDWGSWKEFQVGGSRPRARSPQAAARAGVERFVHISSTSAYGHPPDQVTPDRRDGPAGAERLVPGSLHAQQGRVRATALGHGRRRSSSSDGHSA